MTILIHFLFSVFFLGAFSERPEKMSYTSEDLRLKVLHYRTPCQGVGVQLCYVVRENNKETEFFYDSIEGFDYKWGYNYEIVVERLKVDEPAADASSFKYRLKTQISKTKVSANLRFELPLLVGGSRVVEPDGKNCLYFGSLRINTGTVSCESLTKAEKGIFQHRNGGLRLVKIKTNVR